jgi:DNA-binding transcriptional ArsR family regulator
MPARNGSGLALLADPTRRRLIAELALRPRRPGQLALRLGISRSAVSRQLRLLALAGLVEGHQSTADGRWILYTLSPIRHGQITAWLAGTEIGLDRDGEPERGRA